MRRFLDDLVRGFADLAGLVRRHWRDAVRVVLHVVIGIVMLMASLLVVGSALLWIEAAFR